MDKRTIKRPIEERFWDKVKKTEDIDDCWEWQASLDKTGYGYFSFNKKCTSAHRAVWRITFGEIEKHLMICHKCDNRKCVNPNHLYKGTHDDNMKDMFDRKRNVSPPITRGESRTSSKLTDIKVKEIRERLKMPIKWGDIAEIARNYGVSTKLIYNIKNGKVWRHV